MSWASGKRLTRSACQTRWTRATEKTACGRQSGGGATSAERRNGGAAGYDDDCCDGVLTRLTAAASTIRHRYSSVIWHRSSVLRRCCWPRTPAVSGPSSGARAAFPIILFNAQPSAILLLLLSLLLLLLMYAARGGCRTRDPRGGQLRWDRERQQWKPNLACLRVKDARARTAPPRALPAKRTSVVRRAMSGTYLEHRGRAIGRVDGKVKPYAAVMARKCYAICK